MNEQSEATRVTFEQGYDRLQAITSELESASVEKMVELIEEGQGLLLALREYLDRTHGRLDEIERGENLPRYLIGSIAAGDQVADGGITALSAGEQPPPDASVVQDDFAPGSDDIPF